MKNYKRILAGMLSLSLILMTLPVHASALQQTTQRYQNTHNSHNNQSSQQKEILKKWQTQSNKAGQSSVDFQVSWDKDNGIPDFVQGFVSEEPVKTSQEAIDFVKKNGALFNLGDGQLRVKRSEKDDYGMTHYRVVQEADQVPIYGKELIVHTDKNNKVYAINGDLQPGLETVKWRNFVQLTESQCIEKSKAHLDIDELDKYLINDPDIRLHLYEYEGEWYLVNLITLQFNEPYPANYKIFVDVSNGNIVNAYNAVADATAKCYGTDSFGKTRELNGYEQNGTYYLYDNTHNAVIETYTLNNTPNAQLPGYRVTSSTNQFTDPNHRVAVDTHSNLKTVYEFFLREFGRRGFDDRDSTIKGSVHYYDQQSGKNNAFWNGTQVLFGDGDGRQFGSFGSALDVVAHEFTHAVTQYTANLEYYGQSGAINESMSDVFGILCEGQEANWWLMGEDCYTPGRAGDALRDAKNPGAVDQPQPAHMNEYVNTTRDNGGVHINSGIPNKAFYHITSDVGFKNSGKIYYRALTNYLTPQSDFMDLRNAVLQSAGDIFGSGSSQYTSVQNAFSIVGLGAASTSDTFEPNDNAAKAYGPLERDKDYESYISTASDIDVYKFTSPKNGIITVSLSNIASDYDLYLYNSSGQLVDRSEKDGPLNESISYEGSAGNYYIKIAGYNGAYNASKPYTLRVNYPNTSAEDTSDNEDNTDDTSSETAWKYEDINYNTPHDYPSKYKYYLTYSKPGASNVAVHFSRFETEENYDFVEIYNKNKQLVTRYTGTLSPFWTSVEGDTMYIQLVSDEFVNGYGYQLDKAAYK